MSLAAALAIPATVDGGGPLAGRDLVLLVTFGVIVFTLVVQGLTLPAVVRWAHLPEDSRETEEQRLAQREATRAAMDAMEDRAAELGVAPVLQGRADKLAAYREVLGEAR